MHQITYSMLQFTRVRLVNDSGKRDIIPSHHPILGDRAYGKIFQEIQGPQPISEHVSKNRKHIRNQTMLLTVSIIQRDENSNSKTDVPILPNEYYYYYISTYSSI